MSKLPCSWDTFREDANGQTGILTAWIGGLSLSLVPVGMHNNETNLQSFSPLSPQRHAARDNTLVYLQQQW